DGHRDRLAGLKRRDLAGRRPTAFVAAGFELLGKSETVLRHPGVRRDQNEVRVRQRRRERARDDEECAAERPRPRNPYRRESRRGNAPSPERILFPVTDQNAIAASRDRKSTRLNS